MSEHEHRRGHSHAVSSDADLRWLGAALALNAGFMAVELVAGILASSLALLSDAAHMLTDAGAIALALLAARLARRQAGGSMTYGFGRAEVLSAQLNGLTLVILSGFIVYEAIARLVSPPHVNGSLMLAIALAGVAVNLGAALVIARAERRSLNVEGALRHNLVDAYAAAGTAVAATVILVWGFQRADPIASLLIALPMIVVGARLVKASARVFLEAAPEGIDPQAIGFAMAAQVGVREVHDLHVWEVTTGFPALSAHLLVAPELDCHALRRTVEAMLAERFAIEHTTLQVEHEPTQLLEIGSAG
ncbi:MAG TPA: cation diffusion facilitator family transporter [Solirubrobacteraceae bacterium]|nr:cation diffusion facilitator family transporter [Solirubrobacteraceae bacterium]